MRPQLASCPANIVVFFFSWLSINFLHVLLLVYVWNLCSYVMISKQKCCFHLNSCTVKSCFKHSQFIFMENFEAPPPPVWSMKNTCNIYSIWNKEHAYLHFQYFPALPILFRLALEVNWCLPSSAQVSIMIIKTCFFFLVKKNSFAPPPCYHETQLCHFVGEH